MTNLPPFATSSSTRLRNSALSLASTSMRVNTKRVLGLPPVRLGGGEMRASLRSAAIFQPLRHASNSSSVMALTSAGVRLQTGPT